MEDFKPYIIGISGGSGSGKTTFVKELRKNLLPHQISLVSQDNYYKPIEEQHKDGNGIVNFDLPSAIDKTHFYNDIKSLSLKQSVELKEYGFNNAALTENVIHIDPTPVIIMEGLFIFHFEEIRNLIDFSIYIDVDENYKLNRRIKRDSAERGYPKHEVLYQWHNHVVPCYNKYLKPFKNQVDVIIKNNISFNAEILEVTKLTQNKLDLVIC